MTILCVMVHSSASLRAADAPTTGGYAVVVSRATHSDAAWKRVVDALVRKHAGATVVTYDKHVNESLAALRKQFPRYTCFVAKPGEATRAFVADVHVLTRKLDDDVYTDTYWGILTGYDAANALRIARHDKPLVVRKVASGTEVALEMCEQGTWFCELVKNKHVQKDKGTSAKELRGPDDTTKALADTLTKYGADLFVTSGHATEHDWQIGYRYRNGSFISAAGQLYGRDTSGKRFTITSDNPKVYLPIGNCLMGHIDGPDAMALAWMNSAGVNQMIGYTVVTWYGYAGWGCLDYFVEQPGRYTFNEAFFANQHALLHRLDTYFPGTATADVKPGQQYRGPVRMADAGRAIGLTPRDAVGLLFDRDVVAFYGDPKWSARMAPSDNLAWEQKLTVKGGVYTLDIIPKRGKRTFEPVNRNGAQRGWRPIVELLPHRIKDVKLIAGETLHPTIADDFILVPNPRQCDPARPYKVVFSAKPLE